MQIRNKKHTTSGRAARAARFLAFPTVRLRQEGIAGFDAAKTIGHGDPNDPTYFTPESTQQVRALYDRLLALDLETLALDCDHAPDAAKRRHVLHVLVTLRFGLSRSLFLRGDPTISFNEHDPPSRK